MVVVKGLKVGIEVGACDTNLIVVVLCADYQQKEWCHLEWRAIRDLIKKRHDRIMFLRP